MSHLCVICQLIAVVSHHHCVCVQFNDVLLLCKSLSLSIGQRQQYRVKTLMDIDGVEVRRLLFSVACTAFLTECLT